MFTNKGNRTPEQLPAVADPVSQRRVLGSAKPTLLAPGVKIIGSIEADGAEVQVDGEIEGNVRGGSLTIGETGMVRGDIVSESVLVNGRVEGSVRARKVQLGRNAHVVGDIIHQSLSVEMGAVFEGQCRYLQDPLKAEEPAVVNAPQLGGPSPFSEAPVDSMAPSVVVSGQN